MPLRISRNETGMALPPRVVTPSVCVCVDRISSLVFRTSHVANGQWQWPMGNGCAEKGSARENGQQAEPSRRRGDGVAWQVCRRRAGATQRAKCQASCRERIRWHEQGTTSARVRDTSKRGHAPKREYEKNPPSAVSRRTVLTADELELRYATAGALAGTTDRLYADCNSGFKVRYRSVPTVQSGYTITH